MSPSTFASAAASGNNANSPRLDAPGEWSRRPNGATQTFRRPSAAQSSTAAPPSRENAASGRNSLESVPAYIPPHRNGASTEYRYNKDQLISLFRAEKEAGNLNEGLSGLFVGGWESNLSNGINTSPWARRDDQRDAQTGADICWDKDGTNPPLGLKDLTAEEKELFTSSVNSPIKPPTQTAKDGGAPRKSSISGPQSPGGFGLASPTRPSNRRRDTSESYPFPPAQPQNQRYARDDPGVADPPAALIRRRTDFGREQEAEPEKAKEPNPFPLKRSGTGGSMAAPWSSSRFSPIAFGGLDPSDAAPKSELPRGESRFKAIMQEAEDEEDRQMKKFSSDQWRDLSKGTLGDPFPADSPTALQAEDGPRPSQDEIGLAPQKTPLRGNEAMSPDTNPYQSPENDKVDTDDVSVAFPGLGGFAPEESMNILGLANLGRAFDVPADRSQSSSAGPRGLAPLPGLGSNSAWTPNLPTAGTPTRDRPVFGSFGDSLFSLDNQSLSGPAFGPPPGSFARPRLGQILPQGMTDSLGEALFDPQDFSNLGRTFGGIGPARETESPMRANRIFDDMSAPLAEEKSSPVFTTAVTPSSVAAISAGRAFPPSLEAQMRTMVMPDRMKWQYKDHHGNTQGPFSGLEMHDWYKAGYFSPELLIKKLEDPDFEPLAQLIRKIGNSREPFLVPQVGIPHDPPPQRTWTGPSNAGVQPPFPNSFPSFGTTLTAEQQNDLERRKQESQFLMARQKEHLAQQQLLIKMQQQIHPQPGIFPPLSHQASTPSLHSQPSYGNMAPSTAFPPGQQGLMDGNFRGSLPGEMPEDMPGLMERLTVGRTNQPAPPPSGPPAQNDAMHAQQVAAMLNDRARLQREQEAENQNFMLNDSSLAQAVAERHQQFHDLQNTEQENMPPMPRAPEAMKEKPVEKRLQEQSITQQVQAAVSAKSSQPTQWTRVDPTTMQPIAHPPQSSSPMPAPVAQRRQNVADTLTASSPSPAQTPSAETPSASIAPWAKEVAEVAKGPSLKEIQEAEAKRAAQREEIAAAARRAALEKEILAQQSAVQNPGLPSSSTWASSSNATAGNPGVWSKPAPAARNAVPASKKTLAQIQKEEEARKTRVAQSSASVVGAASTSKRYADLASKNAPVAGAVAAGGAWTTVGASGKVKGAAPPTAPTRTVSSSATATQRPKVARSATMGQAAIVRADAMEEFKKWAVKELRSHLDKSINVESFVDNLQQLGLDPDVLTEAVHFASTTIDSRHFTDEFIRRHKLAEKGIAPEPASLPSTSGGAGGAAANGGAASNNGGWSEVAKKGGQADKDAGGSNGNFRVVQGKRRGGRR